MLRAILISFLVGASVGVSAFMFGHAWASKVYAEIVGGLQKAKTEAEEELARLRQKY